MKVGTYTRRELIDLVEGKIELTQFNMNPRINRKNNSAGITEMVFNSDLIISITSETGHLATLHLHIM